MRSSSEVTGHYVIIKLLQFSDSFIACDK